MNLEHVFMICIIMFSWLTLNELSHKVFDFFLLVVIQMTHEKMYHCVHVCHFGARTDSHYS